MVILDLEVLGLIFLIFKRFFCAFSAVILVISMMIPELGQQTIIIPLHHPSRHTCLHNACQSEQQGMCKSHGHPRCRRRCPVLETQIRQSSFVFHK